MEHTAPIQSEIHNIRYVEYVDVFSHPDITPTAALGRDLLLFDNFDGTDPLERLYLEKGNKMYQQIFITIVNGTYTLEINGKEETLTAGMSITIMPENITKTKYVSPNLRYFVLVIYPKLSSQIYTDIGITYSNARMSLRHFTATLTSKQLQHLSKLYVDMKNDLLNYHYEYQHIYIRCLLNAFIIDNLNIFDYDPIPLQGNSNSRQYDIYCRFLALLNKHSMEHRSVQHYADQLGISSKYLSFVCISYSKKNASTWIDESVIQKAKALMIVHHYTFVQTSEALHFPTVSSFSRFFKRVTGNTPKEYINKN